MPLAAGGMARIYIGRATGIGSFERHVVLKLITPERANDAIAVQMFLDEARLAASLNHQNVAQVFEVGEDSGIHYLAMEYVHGQDLRALLAKAGSQGTRIPLELALTTVAGAAAGLHHAHERRGPDGLPLGIVHRDVSPSNIMIGYDGAVKLLDFGIAKATSRSVETQSGIIKGKFAYMAPEQCRGRDVDRRSDVFSLGIILYEISTQHRCFRADSDFDTMHRIVTGDIVRPTRLVPSYPAALEAIVMKALATDAAQRYQSSGQLLEAIEAFAVVSRLSLSTMGLGRFMRDMFGEVAEPWVGSPRTSQPVIPKEATISSTDGRSDVVASPQLPPHEHVRVDRAAPVEMADDSDSGGVAATLVMDPSRPRGLMHPNDWQSFGSEPVAVAAMALPDSMLPDTVPADADRDSPPISAALTAPPPNAPAQTGPALPGLPSTRHGYASGAGITLPGAPTGPTTPGLAYPRYEPPPSADDEPADLDVRPSRTILFAGAAILAVGVFVMIALLVGGSSKDDLKPRGVEPTETSAAGAPADAPSGFIPIKIDSTPRGADVLIAGAKVGVTPLDIKLRRGTKVAPLLVHLAGYDDFTTKVDLADGLTPPDPIGLVKTTKPVAPLVTPPLPPPAPIVTSPPPPIESGEHDKEPAHATTHSVRSTSPSHATSGTKTTSTHVSAPAVPAKPKCQPAGAVNPYDTSCDGHACPPCQ
ncbi:MAG TPA: protein kinase [Kofleriaceae bacterium]